MSIATENFLKAIYMLNQGEVSDCKSSDVARKLGVSSAAVTDMAQKLAVKKLLHYEKYQNLTLTDQGEKIALSVLRKHRLWETLLYQLFDMDMHEIHREAELLEHSTSDFLAGKLDAYLGFPEEDPHGDPIPNGEGTLPVEGESVIMSKAVSGEKYWVKRLASDNKNFFDFCARNKIAKSVQILIKNQDPEAGLTEILVGEKTIVLPLQYTEIIKLSNFK